MPYFGNEKRYTVAKILMEPRGTVVEFFTTIREKKNFLALVG